MQISDTPFFVIYNYNIHLDELGKNNKIKPVKRPLTGWIRKIIDFRDKVKNTFGNIIRLIHFRPLNYNNNYFTLLEINEREEKIRYYNLIINRDVIEGTTKLTRINKLVQVKYFFKIGNGDTADAIIKRV
jgi:hypothetical protein